MRILLYLPLAFFVLGSAALAATFTVTNTDDSGPGSLRQALTDANAAAGPDTIEFALPNAGPAGNTINLLSALPDISGDLTINGPGMDLLTLNRNSATAFTILSTNANVVISGLTVHNGLAPETAVVGTPWSTAYGGGIYNRGNLTVNGCRIAGNRVVADVARGGGIANTGTLNLNSSIVSGNDARSWFRGTSQQGQYGGGIFNSGTATVNDVTITGSGHAGAIYGFLGTMTVRRANIFANNTMGVVNQSSTLWVYDSSIYQNVVSVDEQGSVLSAGGFSSITQGPSGSSNLINTTIAQNVGYEGGGVSLSPSSVTINITNCTIVGNRKINGAGGGVSSGALITMQNSIVAGNIGSSGPSDIGFFSSNPAYPPSSFNLIGISAGPFQNGINGNIVGTAAAPADPQLLPFNYYGGEMPVFMPLSTSPAINAGSPVLFSDHDERRVVRPVGVRQDIGAAEFNLAPNRYLPEGEVGTAYDQTFQAFGLSGYSKFQFSISAGSLPPGMTLQDLGSNMAKVSGTPSSTGTFTFTLLATDPLGYTVSADYSITILPTGSISLVPVQGRVTKSDGISVRNAFVQAIDSNGRVVAESLTNPFGYFHFASLQTFAPYTFAIRHKTLTAAAPTVTITANAPEISIVTQ